MPPRRGRTRRCGKMERPVKIVTVTDSQTTSNGYVLLEGRDAIVIDPNLEGEIVETP